MDPYVESVVGKYRTRSEIGIKKYGTTLERKDLQLDEWLNHLQEELMDATLYIERVRDELRNVLNRAGVEKIHEGVRNKDGDTEQE